MDTRLHVKAGALVTRPVRLSGTQNNNQQPGNVVTYESTSDIRDLKAIIDKLRKELERKDSRNDKLSKDMVALRTIVSNQEREMRILTGALEKTAAEKNRLALEVTKIKDYVEKADQQLAKANDTTTWEKTIKDCKSNEEHYKVEHDKLRNLVDVRDSNIANLEKEIQILRRALTVQKFYESESIGNTKTNSKSTSGSKEIVRSLYYDLGNAQTENHNLALTLAEKHKEIEAMTLELNQIKKYKEDITPQIQEVLQHVDDLTQDNMEKDKYIEELTNSLEKAMKSNELYEKQVETLGEKIMEIEVKHNTILKEKDEKIKEFEELLPKAQREAVIAQGRADILQQAIVHHEHQSKLAQQKLDIEWNKLAMERSNNAETIQQNENLIAQVETLRNSLTKALLTRDEITKEYETYRNQTTVQIQELSIDLQSLQHQYKETDMFLTKAREYEHDVTLERDEALHALNETMEAIKVLSAKCQDLKHINKELESRAVEAEKSLESLKQGKQHISNAIFDAFQKERNKTAALEKVLQEMPVDRRYYETLQTHQISGVTPMRYVSPNRKKMEESPTEDSNDDISGTAEDILKSSDPGNISTSISSSDPDAVSVDTNKTVTSSVLSNTQIAERRQEDLARLRQTLRQIDDKASTPWKSTSEE